MSGSPGLNETNLGIGLPKSASREWVQTLLSKNFFDEKNIDSTALDNVYKYFTDKKSYLNMIRLTKESAGFDAGKFVSDAKVPVLGIWGKYDIVTPVEAWVPLFERQSLAMEIIENSGHSPMYETPEAFSEIILEYISKWKETLLNKGKDDISRVKTLNL